jgi:hypothetical protein
MVIAASRLSLFQIVLTSGVFLFNPNSESELCKRRVERQRGVWNKIAWSYSSSLPDACVQKRTIPR